jgi:hypothetical protein
MASRGKKKTTMAKLAREGRLRERQQDKRAKKDARKRAPAATDSPEYSLDGDTDGADLNDAAVVPSLIDA